MGKSPVCPLCSHELEKQEDVKIQVGGSNLLSYTLAWVCVNCSAAFPIAAGKGGVIRKARPLFEDREPSE